MISAQFWVIVTRRMDEKKEGKAGKEEENSFESSALGKKYYIREKMNRRMKRGTKRGRE